MNIEWLATWSILITLGFFLFKRWGKVFKTLSILFLIIWVATNFWLISTVQDYSPVIKGSSFVIAIGLGIAGIYLLHLAMQLLYLIVGASSFFLERTIARELDRLIAKIFNRFHMGPKPPNTH